MVAATNLNSGDGPLTAQVNCLKARRIKTRPATVEIPEYAADGVRTASARCPKRTKLLSGGFAGPGDASGGTADIHAFGSRKRGRRSWEVSAFNFGGTAGVLTAYVYCEKKKRG